jgi:hypothetical protein
MQGISRVDSWTQFVNLVQDARTRNQAISNAKNTPASGRVSGVGRPVNQAAVTAPRRAYSTSPVVTTTSMNTPKAATKTLGSFFDAYA